MLEKLKTLLGALLSKPPSAPDGKTDQEAAAIAPKKETSIVHDLLHLDLQQVAALAQGLTTVASGEPIDDKELVLEHGINMLQTLPPDSGLGNTISNDFITMLWHDLPHPAQTNIAPSTRYRSGDGSGNNPWWPEMGKAGSPYARSVPPTQSKGSSQPDPELVFDQLLRRKGPFRAHPSGLNRMFFSFAAIVIHEVFQSSRSNPWINDTSSYVDLSTLYGNTKEEQVRVRTYTNGTLFRDSIASDRIMAMPPGVASLLILFSRNHNHIAANLLTVNEDGKYKPVAELSEDEKKWQDEDIFQIARNINVGYFASAVLRDYVAAILNTPRANSTWSLDLGAEIRKSGQRVTCGTGNVISIEFSVLYHWHAALSAADCNWVEGILRAHLPDLKSIDEVTADMYMQIMKDEGRKFMETPAREWVFGGMQRGADGAFSDCDLANILKDCIEEPAHAFGAHSTPTSIKVIEILGQLQSRNIFKTCTLNEFRRYLNLATYKSFEDWNPDKETARAAELLYGHIDNLELYPGLMAEVTKPSMRGSGLCPGQTMGRGILDDAVSLIRGDRFLSSDFNSTTLSNWGFAKLQTVPGGSYGGILPYLLLNGLPGSFTGTSAYALLPLYTPEAAKEILTANKVVDRYDLKRPANGMDVVGIHTQEGCKKAFADRDTFATMYEKMIRECANGHEFMIGWDDAERHDPRSKMLHQAFFEDGFEKNVTDFFRSHIVQQIRSKSLKYSRESATPNRRSIDIVRDVTNVVPILWLADRFALPLKTEDTPHGLLTVPQAFQAFLVLFIYQGFNIIPANEWVLRDGALKASAAILPILKAHLETQKGGPTETIIDRLAKDTPFEVGPHADRLYHALDATGLPVADLATDCMGIGVPVAGNLTQQASLLINLFLSPGYEEYKARIIELAHAKDDPAADRELQGFVFEGIRHAGVVPGLPRVATKDATIEDGARGPVHVKKGQPVLIAVSRAAMDPVAFPNPERLDPHRPFSAYTLLGYGMHFCFGSRVVGAALAATLREVFCLKNVRRAGGPQGRFAVVEHELAGVVLKKYLDKNAKESPIPTTLTLEYEEEE
ncbi:hypothetical protein MY5147_003294 [Beauveria neobassiana]